jgi:paraquat-inducible protein B
LAQTVASANKMLQQSQALLAHVDTVLQPDAPLQYQVRMTMQDVSNAARSVRVLADSIERNPSVLVRGKAVPGEK